MANFRGIQLNINSDGKLSAYDKLKSFAHFLDAAEKLGFRLTTEENVKVTRILNRRFPYSEKQAEEMWKEIKKIVPDYPLV